MLLDSFSQQWFDGVMSFQDPRQPSHYLPFWVLVWWNKLGLVVEARQAWSTAWSWISGCANEVHPSFNIIRDAPAHLRPWVGTLSWKVLLVG